MQVTFKLYRKRDGAFMFYANNDRGVSFGFGADAPMFYSTKYKVTEGQKKLYDAVYEIFAAESTLVEGIDVSKANADLNCGKLFIVEDGYCGGVKVDADGMYLLLNSGNLIYLSASDGYSVEC